MLKNYLINELGDSQMKKWEKFSKEEIGQFVKDSTSYAQLARKVGYDVKLGSGSAYRAVHQMVDELDLDTSHFIGQGWNKDNFDYSRFCYGKSIKTARALPAIAALRGYKCECCGLSEWMGKEITLEVHHKDGDSLNNELDNLQLLCPNCHSMTDNWRGKGIKKKNIESIDEETLKNALLASKNIRQALIALGLSPKGGNYNRAKEIIKKYNISFQHDEKQTNYCCDCGKEIENGSIRCKDCENKLRKQEAIDDLPINREELKQMIRTTSFLQISKNFNVSDNTIRKWCRNLNLPCRTHDIKKISNEEWELI